MLKQGHRPFLLHSVWLLALLLLPAFGQTQPLLETTVLYDGALGGTPESQQYFAYVALADAASQTYAGGVTTLDTTTFRRDQAGYFSTDHPAFDRQAGYNVVFSVQLLEETHAIAHRAGFSLIALSSDLQGIELGFWTDEIWAQEGGSASLFTHAEGASFNTTAALTTFELAIRVDEYVLFADGSQILSGPLRDYTALEGLIDPYETPNLLFLGDNTSRGMAKVNVAYVAVQTVSPPTGTPSSTATAAATATATATATAATTPIHTSGTTAPAPTAALTLTATPAPQPARAWNWWFPLTAGYPPQ